MCLQQCDRVKATLVSDITWLGVGSGALSAYVLQRRGQHPYFDANQAQAAVVFGDHEIQGGVAGRCDASGEVYVGGHRREPVLQKVWVLTKREVAILDARLNSWAIIVGGNILDLCGNDIFLLRGLGKGSGVFWL